MPIFEFVCGNPGCSRIGLPVERYLSTYDKPNPECSECRNSTQRMVSRFAVVWTGALSRKYLDTSKEGGHTFDGSHWAWRTKGPDGKRLAKPEPVFIETFDQQREFCKSEGLVNPKDIGPAEVGDDGKSLSTRGLPGCW